MADISAQTGNVIKGTGEIYARLFDHRPFLQGEIKYFLKEFEEKRNDREVQRLFEILENVTEIRETQIDRLCRNADAHMCNLTGNLEVALRMCNKIVEREDKVDVDEDLGTRREMRRKEWEDFVSDIHNKNSKIDQTFQDKEQDLIMYYKDLEEKLHIASGQEN